MQEHADLAESIRAAIHTQALRANTVTQYRQPLVGFASAEDPRFHDLRRLVDPQHMLPCDLLPGARSVVSFFLPFAPGVVEANARHREQVAPEWALAYVETNALIGRIVQNLVEQLAAQGIKAAAQPATHNFDPVTLSSPWSHKSVAVLAGLGSFGLHQLVITNAGCAGRFGSLVVDVELPVLSASPREHCLYLHDGSCTECVSRCPVAALAPHTRLDKQRCWQRLQVVAQQFDHLGRASACGKCVLGPCALKSAVPDSGEPNR